MTFFPAHEGWEAGSEKGYKQSPGVWGQVPRDTSKKQREEAAADRREEDVLPGAGAWGSQSLLDMTHISETDTHAWHEERSWSVKLMENFLLQNL